jgi:hypothetical protein
VTKPKFEQLLIFPPIDNVSSRPHGPYYRCSEVDAYIDKLFKDSVHVCGFYDEDKKAEAFGTRMENHNPTHKAWLIGIEEIKPMVSFSHEHVWDSYKNNEGLPDEMRCRECGKKLKAKWESADE